MTVLGLLTCANQPQSSHGEKRRTRPRLAVAFAPFLPGETSKSAPPTKLIAAFQKKMGVKLEDDMVYFCKGVFLCLVFCFFLLNQDMSDM